MTNLFTVGDNEVALTLDKKLSYDEKYIALMERNADRVKRAKTAMGKMWILHPENQIKRKTQSK